MASSGEASQHDPFCPPPNATLCALVNEARCRSRFALEFSPSEICQPCLAFYDSVQLERYVINHDPDQSVMEIITKKRDAAQKMKETVENKHNKFLCAFEDPDFDGCKWRDEDFNLKLMRKGGECTLVAVKGKACNYCWPRWMETVGTTFNITDYFDASGILRDDDSESDDSVEDEQIGTAAQGAEITVGDDQDVVPSVETEDDDLGYNIVLP
ncbi:hypothetical protein BU24DRAFT_407018 [Aaosphaeria arxii CBS 175.79]|uniref:Uncharacterized protein n=1 Tax=Aaosphaeria arxii CBS 175.79 TaxID=1450172 RepID=A0A6A5XVG2_9PLEO|nr:uncharacterized protein BU24DRAFT_407018 [Aaosphaeria arxii CBS 175.79]KAF2016926.1 hypothetical protein BU24DRAFT_407018 [Aaosphaeria arxii CBS 175.79]